MADTDTKPLSADDAFRDLETLIADSRDAYLVADYLYQHLISPQVAMKGRTHATATLSEEEASALGYAMQHVGDRVLALHRAYFDLHERIRPGPSAAASPEQA